jgi:hypothetical protein
MRKTLALLFASFAFASLLPAQPPPPPPPQQLPPRPAPPRPGTPQPQQAKRPDALTRAKNMLARTGGMVQAAAEGPSILFLNSQTRVPETEIQKTVGMITRTLRLAGRTETRTASHPVTAALQALADTNTAAVVVLADAPGYPMLLLAPESRWALVNVDALAEGGVPDALIEERVTKQLWRAFGYLMGAANSAFPQCLMKPVVSPADLDALTVKAICPEPFAKILGHAQKIGMQPVRMTSYRKAVEEGWAPAPTNDFQRAIWNELKKK